MKADIYTWSTKSAFNTPRESKFEEDGLICPEFHALADPIRFVELFITEELVSDIVYYTNLYNIQRSTSGFKLPVKRGGSWSTSYKKVTPPVNNAEMKRVLGMIFYMGIIKYPTRRLYWSTKTRIPFIADNMSRNRFDDILSILHFNDNLGCVTDKDSSDYDKMYKLLHLITYLHEKFQSSVETETCLAIDEQMVPFKGRHSAKVYMPKKPCKWGYKLRCKADVSGYIYDFEITQEKKAKGALDDVPDGDSYGEIECVIL